MPTAGQNKIQREIRKINCKLHDLGVQTKEMIERIAQEPHPEKRRCLRGALGEMYKLQELFLAEKQYLELEYDQIALERER